MAAGLRYQGGFHSQKDTLYEIYIYQEGYEGEPSDVAFSGNPLVIEWPEVDKLEPVQSSNATLELFSDSDRQFVDLYNVEAGSVRLDVYREGSLYWSGTMDPELYEEPYAYKDGYVVSVTFADFAVLDRLAFDGEGFITVADIISKAMAKCKISGALQRRYLSTTIPDVVTEASLVPGVMGVIADNFFDEDGEAMTWREVLDEVLRPFAYRIIQKEGWLYVYDLNAAYDLDPQQIAWDSDDSVMSYDKLYNNVKVTFSPYARETIAEGEVTKVGDGYTVTTNVNLTEKIKGFDTLLSDTGEGVEMLRAMKYYQITPAFSGQESKGMAWTLKSYRDGLGYVSEINLPSAEIGPAIFRIPNMAYLSNYGNEGGDMQIKLVLNMMADVRYNPFESADMQDPDGGYPNEQGAFDRLKNWCNFAYVPCQLLLVGTDGLVKYHYNNTARIDQANYSAQGFWLDGEGEMGDLMLAYYDWEDRKSNTGLGGFQNNKQCIGYYRGTLPTIFQKRGDGEFIPFPPMSGYLEFRVGSGLPTYDYGWETKDIYSEMRWLLYKSVTISVVRTDGSSVDNKDILTSAWLNKAAKEDLPIDTVVGCLDDPSPTALGQVFLMSIKKPINKFIRAGVTDTLERLMIGTIYSNYSSKYVTLEGEAEILPTWGVYSDSNTDGKFVLLSESQDLLQDTSYVKMSQFSGDNYQGMEYDG